MSKFTEGMGDILNGRHYGTLSTLNDDESVHMTPVWYLFDNELLFVQSSSTSRKIKNLAIRPMVSLMVDVRTLGAEEWVSASGTAKIVSGDESQRINAKILQRYLTNEALGDSRIGPVFAAGDDNTIVITPKMWRAWDSKSLDDQYFDGLLAKSPEKWFLPH